MRDLPNLDLLRTIAVLLVLLDHILLARGVQWIGSWEVQWIGVVGVFFFFVHTALVLMWSLERKPHTLDFYIRRVFRIYPLAVAVVAICVVTHAPFQGTVDQPFQYHHWPTLRSLMGAFLLATNLQQIQYMPLSVLWTLPYEVQMYVGLPVLFFFVQKNFSFWPVLLLWALAVVVNQPIFAGTPHNLYLCIPYFLPGVIAYIGFSRQKAVFPAWAFVLFLALLLATFMRFPSWRHANLLCLSLGCGLPFFRQIRLQALVAASHTVAKYSYGVYMMHAFGIFLGIHLQLVHSAWAQVLIVLLATGGLAIAGYHLIEKPMIRLGSCVANRAEQRYEQHAIGRYRIAEVEIGR